MFFKFEYLQDPELKPREVHRGLDGLPEIPDGNMEICDNFCQKNKDCILVHIN
jgi:hypothetical protein